MKRLLRAYRRKNVRILVRLLVGMLALTIGDILGAKLTEACRTYLTLFFLSIAAVVVRLEYMLVKEYPEEFWWRRVSKRMLLLYAGIFLLAVFVFSLLDRKSLIPRFFGH